MRVKLDNSLHNSFYKLFEPYTDTNLSHVYEIWFKKDFLMEIWHEKMQSIYKVKFKQTNYNNTVNVYLTGNKKQLTMLLLRL